MPNSPRQPGTVRLFILLLLLSWSSMVAAADRLQLALSTPQDTTLPAPRDALTSSTPIQAAPWVDIKVKSGDTLSGIFTRAGLAADQWRALLALGAAVKPLQRLSPGDTFRLRKTPDGQLAELTYSLGAARTLIVKRTTNGLRAHTTRKNATTRRILVTGTIRQNLVTDLRHAGAPLGIAAQVAHIFAGPHNPTDSLQPGDRFSVVYLAEFVAGDNVHVGPIMAVSLHTAGRNLRAFRHTNRVTGQARYYDSHGQPYAPKILRTPLHYTDISSPFDLNRRHPILGIIRRHTGVDLAAPRGTPVHAGADGVVTFVGRMHGYGRIVKIKHANGYATRYAHLSRFAAHLDKGDHVNQGQTIAYVGESGLATGYHLHYEIRRNGKPHDPLHMALPDGKPLSGAVLTAFTNRIQPLIAELAGQNTTTRTQVAANTGFGQYQACVESGTINSVLALTGRVTPKAVQQIFCSPSG